MSNGQQDSAVEANESAPVVSELVQQMYAAAGEASQLLRAIGSEHRLMILCELMERDKTVTEICEAIGARQSLVSQHLTRLRLDGLVKAERVGHFAFYSIDHPVVRDIVGTLYKHFCATKGSNGRD